ncbi:hypothetical protein FRB94_011497 [Tulasnella sp. JGI-2019a]|nr:hypothetical protein FRB93_009030 [Tulasnella sp. JGI-2019a]KAG8992555.1 hypothetical protein FRB94_011497 [Tulasnella sp. JGI-2019a]KAG9025937.1 hypothetical protein FRB95_009622 [Tulasnella sp. JGI-2019a]
MRDTFDATKLGLRALSIGLQASPIPEPFKAAVSGIPGAVLQIIEIVEATSTMPAGTKESPPDELKQNTVKFLGLWERGIGKLKNILGRDYGGKGVQEVSREMFEGFL